MQLEKQYQDAREQAAAQNSQVSRLQQELAAMQEDHQRMAAEAENATKALDDKANECATLVSSTATAQMQARALEEQVTASEASTKALEARLAAAEEAEAATKVQLEDAHAAVRDIEARCKAADEALKAKLIQAARDVDASNGWNVLRGVESSKLGVRVAEHHTVGVGGCLPWIHHRDWGSLVTIDVMLSAPGEYEGGTFQTSEVDGSLTAHTGFEYGDALFFISHKPHSACLCPRASNPRIATSSGSHMSYSAPTHARLKACTPASLPMKGA